MNIVEVNETNGRRIFHIEVEDSVIEDLKSKGIDVLEEIRTAVRNQNFEGEGA